MIGAQLVQCKAPIGCRTSAFAVPIGLRTQRGIVYHARIGGNPSLILAPVTEAQLTLTRHRIILDQGLLNQLKIKILRSKKTPCFSME